MAGPSRTTLGHAFACAFDDDCHAFKEIKLTSALDSSLDSFNCRRTLDVDGEAYDYFDLKEAEANGLAGIASLPFSLKVLLENLLRHEDGSSVTSDDIRGVAEWLKERKSDKEIAFRPARVLMQDFTGVPAVVDLAAMRDAMAALGGDPNKINPLAPVDLVIDHSVMVDAFGSDKAFQINVDREYERNGERYAFLRWGAGAFDNFRVVPPGTGICHQVNLEYLAQTVWTKKANGGNPVAFPDTLVGTDSHTTMVNGLSVLGWGVGGIEAEAAMLGQPISMLIPEVVGFRLTGELKDGVTATDLVLTVTEMLRRSGVVGKFVEFFGIGLANLPLEDRATIANMAPEYGATCGFFPVDEETLAYLKATARKKKRIALVEDIRQGARALSRSRHAGPGVHQAALSRSRRRRAVARRAETSAGPRAADQGRSGLRRGARQGIRQGARGRQARAGEGQEFRSRPWRRGDRRHHLLHQHLEPLCDDRGRARRQERGEAGLERQAVGQDLARAGLAGGHRLSRQGRLAEGSRPARLQSGRLWLHHLHRQFRAAARGDLADHSRERAGGRRGALRQPQFRRPRQSRRARQLSRLAAARGRLCAGRIGRHRPRLRAARHRRRRRAGLSQGYLAVGEADRQDGAQGGEARDVQGALRRRVPRRSRMAQDRGRGRAHLWLGHALDLCAEPALFRRDVADAVAGHRCRGRAHPRPVPRFHHHRPYLARPAPSSATAPPAAI